MCFQLWIVKRLMIAMFKEGRGGKGWSGDFYNTETIVYEAMVVDT